MNMKIHVVQYESGGIPSEPHLFTSIHDAGDKIEQLVIDNTEFRSRNDGEEVEDYYSAYWEYIEEEGSEDEDTIRYWVLDLEQEDINQALLLFANTFVEAMEDKSAPTTWELSMYKSVKKILKGIK